MIYKKRLRGPKSQKDDKPLQLVLEELASISTEDEAKSVSSI